ncbi:hypothetical protein [Nocardia sp. NBC_01327]|uniref:hypothetical protein n=1 Tax=Nocardia sp. NBC_01327 TaxID=2903593 RepID=UPI002E13F663|nr:hypothetical protein OG326_34520 [Nocardia sp. NBC_01327]
MKAAHLVTADSAARLADFAARTRAAEMLNRTAINLVPSENRMSPAAHAMLATDYANRYFFNQTLAPQGWEFRGGEGLADLETAGCQALSRLTGAEFVNLRPLSGLNGMMIALSGLGGEPGARVVTIAPACGGHYATGALIRRFGYQWVPVNCVDGRVDLTQLEQALATGVSLIYADLQNSRHMLDVTAIGEVARRYPGTRLHVDCSHTLGLILGGAHPNPLDHGAQSISSSLHKSFPGPHHGLLATRDADIDALLRDAQFTLVSSHHFSAALAAAVTALEFEIYGSGYADAVIANARALATALADYGFDVVGDAGSGYTDTHQVWVRLPDPVGVSDRLARWGIRVNIQSDLPGCPGRMWRLGAAEPTVLGATTTDMHELAAVIAQARDGHTSSHVRGLSELRQRLGRHPWWSRTNESERAYL